MPEPIKPTLIDLPAESRGERVLLRPFRVDDADQFFAAVDESRAHLRPWLLWVNQYSSVDDARDYCARCAANWLLRADLTFGIFDAENGQFIGGTGLHNPNWPLRTFEIGYWLRSTAVGKGLMTGAVRILADFALDTLQANRLEIICDVSNEASRRVAERSGFTLEGRLRNVLAATDGGPVDCLVFSLVPDDRQASRPD
jgi:RimJ/RimL family protein N-acetyltransferase